VLAAGLVGYTFAGSVNAQQGNVVFASWGGAFQDALRKAMLEPAAKALGVTVKEDTTNGIQDVRAQITAGKIAWDVTEQELPTCETLKRDGMLEPIDYSVVRTDGIPKELISSHYVGFINSQSSPTQGRLATTGRSVGPTSGDGPVSGKRARGKVINTNLEAGRDAPMRLASHERTRTRLEEVARSPRTLRCGTGVSQSAQLLRDGEIDETT
jgi:putative spermidine/putrescine transport system substrate-binding protein